MPRTKLGEFNNGEPLPTVEAGVLYGAVADEVAPTGAYLTISAAGTPMYYAVSLRTHSYWLHGEANLLVRNGVTGGVWQRTDYVLDMGSALGVQQTYTIHSGYADTSWEHLSIRSCLYIPANTAGVFLGVWGTANANSRYNRTGDHHNLIWWTSGEDSIA